MVDSPGGRDRLAVTCLCPPLSPTVRRPPAPTPVHDTLERATVSDCWGVLTAFKGGLRDDTLLRPMTAA